MNNHFHLVMAIAVVTVSSFSCEKAKSAQKATASAANKPATTWLRATTVESTGMAGSAAAESTVTRDSQSVEFIQIADSSVISYHRFGSECYSIFREPITRSGDTISMNVTAPGDSGQGLTKKTTLIIEAGTLVERSKTTYGLPNKEGGWQQTVITYTPYNGSLPPVGWPTSLCTAGASDSISQKSPAAR